MNTTCPNCLSQDVEVLKTVVLGKGCRECRTARLGNNPKTSGLMGQPAVDALRLQNGKAAR